MAEKITFEIGTVVGNTFTPAVTIFGDERGEAYPHWRLTNLDGWDMPKNERISVADPNGGNYVSDYVTKLGKIITLNFSVFFRNDYDGFQAVKHCAEVLASDDFYTLVKTTEFSESIVTETLSGCYKINDISVDKKTGEFRFTISFGSKNYDVVTEVTDKTVPPVEPVSTDGIYLGEPSTASTPVGVGFFWDGVSKTWVTSNPADVANNPSYHDGTDYAEVGTESWNLGLQWEPVTAAWVNFPVKLNKLTLDPYYAKIYGEFMWTDYGQDKRVRGYYNSQDKTLTTVNLKADPTYHDGLVHREKGSEDWNNKMWWDTNGRKAGWVSSDPGPDLGPRDGSPGTYYGQFRARWTQGDNVYWNSANKQWGTYNPTTAPDYVAGTTDKQEFMTSWGPIYWNINISAYQNMTEFYNSRGEYPALRSNVPGDWHGQEAYGENLFWDSMNQYWSPTDWTKDFNYHAGVDDGNQSFDSFAQFLYWNSKINFYQTDSEYYNTNGYYPWSQPM